MDENRWIAGISATVIGALIVWWLTQPGGLLNRKQHILILAFAPSSLVAIPSQPLSAHAEVYNDGNVPAQQCRVKWDIRGSKSEPALTDVFGLRPENGREFTLQQAGVPDSPGTYNSSASVECKGFGSDPFSVQIKVIKNPVRNPLFSEGIQRRNQRLERILGKPHILITAFAPSSLLAYPNGPLSARVEVLNDGIAPAQLCLVEWDIHAKSGPIVTQAFGLEAGQKGTFPLAGLVPDSPGVYDSSARVECLNSVSDPVSQPIIVLRGRALKATGSQ